MNTSSSPTRALVLGGGGSAGNAWLIGVVAGLADAGLDVAAADLIVGTSAGSTAAAQITAAPPAELYRAVLDAPPVPSRSSAAWVTEHLARGQRLIDASADAADMRRRFGAAAIEAAAASEGSTERWRSIVASRLPRPEWPEARILITAVDARSGDPVVFDSDSGVDLVDAVAASCSSGAAYRIGDREYIDGGYRTNADNADLAAGFDRVLVLTPFAGENRTPVSWGLHLATQVDALRQSGALVEVVAPRQPLGVDSMDPATRLPAARDGFAQGRELAPGLRESWG